MTYAVRRLRELWAPVRARPIVISAHCSRRCVYLQVDHLRFMRRNGKTDR